MSTGQMFVSVVLGAGALLALAWWMSGRRIRIARATIASNLARYARVRPGTLVQVVGYDMHCLLDDEYKLWRDVVRRWADKGAEIEYVVQKCSEQQLKALRSRKQEFDPDGRLHIYEMDKAKVAGDLLEEMKTFHWATFTGPDQLWLESEHPVGTTEAYGCEYVRAGDKDTRYAQLSAKFKEMKNASSAVV